MAIKTNLHLGKGFTRGNVFSIKRLVHCPTGSYVTGGYLTFKESTDDPDPGVLQETAQIEDSGSSSQLARVRFDISNADSLLFTADSPYYFDLLIFYADGSKITIESGVTSFQERVGSTYA